MSGFLGGLASGLSQGLGQADSINAGRAAAQDRQQRLAMDQERLDMAKQQSASTMELNTAKLKGQDLKNQKLNSDMQFNTGVMKAAATGGYAAALDYAQHTGHYDWANARMKEQQDLNNSIATGMKLKSDASTAELGEYNNRIKAVGALGGSLFQDPQFQTDPEGTYKRYLPIIKQVWPDAPKQFDDKTENYLKIAVGQSIQQNTNYTRQSAGGRIIAELHHAREAGDTEAVSFYTGQLKKMSYYTNSMTGEVINTMGDAPDTHQGSVDTKLGSVGLAAGSRIPPVPGVFVVKQPLNNMMDAQYKDYDKNNGIAPKDRIIRNMKAAQGFNTIIRPDGTNEMVPIVGGPSDKPRASASESIRVSAIQAGQKAFNDYADMIIDPATKQLKAGVANILTGELAQASYIGKSTSGLVNQITNTFVSPQARALQAAQSNIIEGVLRGQSGATININERPKFEQELLPQPGDDEKTIKFKLNITHEILTGALDIMKMGPGGQPIKTKDGDGIVDWQTIAKAKDYSLHGGDLFDITRGDGVNPEKARQQQLKDLSYDPKQIEFYKSAQNNGQGRDLAEDEVRALLDQMKQASQQKGAGQ